MIRLFRLVTGIWLLATLLMSCGTLAPLLSQPTPVPVPTATPTLYASTATLPASSESRVLRVWLPARFNPNLDTPAANSLKQRFADFQSQHSGIELDVRVKNEEGDTSLLDSLFITQIAAPAALPDLVALSRADLEHAALKGVLHPIDGLTPTLDDVNWYNYARQLAHIQNTAYGLPFAGDALVLVYRPSLFGEGAFDWDNAMKNSIPLAFPAADSQALFPVSMYLSAGGGLTDEQDRPVLNEQALTQTLIFHSRLSPAPWLANLENPSQAWQAFLDGQASWAVVWISLVLNSTVADIKIEPLPGLQGSPFTLATGWVWALAGSDPQKQQLAIELADYLMADDFLGGWQEAAGYLPTRPSGVTSFPDEQNSSVTIIAESAQPIPSDDLLAVIGPIMQEALIRVLSGEQVDVVVRSAMERLK